MADWPYNTARWQRLRKAHLSIEPLCRGCAPRVVCANTVDHVTPISEGGPAFPGHDGLASYCASCHGAKTARGAEAGAVRSTKPRKGCDADGNPLDPAHPWGSDRHSSIGNPAWRASPNRQKSLRAEQRRTAAPYAESISSPERVGNRQDRLTGRSAASYKSRQNRHG